MATPTSHIVFNFSNVKAKEEDHILDPLTYKNDDEFWDVFIGNFFIKAMPVSEDLVSLSPVKKIHKIDFTISEQKKDLA